jgi:hypothetical protein
VLLTTGAGSHRAAGVVSADSVTDVRFRYEHGNSCPAGGPSLVRAVSRALLTLLLVAWAAPAFAVTVTAMWDPNAEPNIAGYKLSYGTQTGVYGTVIDVGNVTSYSLSLNPGQYYFAVQAYNTDGLISPYSIEVPYLVTTGTAPAIVSVTPNSGPVGTPVAIAGSGFGVSQGTSTVSFNSVTASPTSWSDTSISVPVPSGATTGNVTVTVGGTASNGVTFTVNRPPTLTAVANQTNPENATVSLPLVGSDPDGNPLTYSATNLPPGAGINASTGLISGTLTFASAGSYAVTATVSDGTLSASRSFTWTVTDVNRAPTLTADREIRRIRRMRRCRCRWPAAIPTATR